MVHGIYKGIGYGVLDGFHEGDTFLHSWEMLARIIDHPDCQDIVVDVCASTH